MSAKQGDSPFIIIMVDKNKLSGRTREIKATVPEEVAEFYENRARQFGSTRSASVAVPLCLFAYDEIKEQYTRQPGTDLRPR